jgi:hypothetical protein
VKTRIAVTVAAALAVALVTSPASPVLAGPQADELSKCLVQSTSDQDRRDLVRWIFASAAQHPDVADFTTVTEEQRSEMSTTIARLFERVLTESCRTQYHDATQNEGPQTLGVSFGVLVQTAMRGLIEDPAVSKALGGVDAKLDKAKLAAAASQSP